MPEQLKTDHPGWIACLTTIRIAPTAEIFTAFRASKCRADKKRRWSDPKPAAGADSKNMHPT